ncbi:hypothetical protein AVEN_113403-1 [Araneus ventricosus]|uniref:Uncharacterized protein n=1 Tax=Araneus ventricosus TaxID=182803 RepID=A0A4Y2I0U6_ARAVE|nr:hypothetical protein AVEN_113403-1 [Araneus ventricosus]
MALQCHQPSRGPSCTQHSPCPFSPGSSVMQLFPVGLSEVYLGGDPMSTTLKDNILRAVTSIPGDMLLSTVKNIVYGMRCEDHENGGRIERGLVLWFTVISSL